MEDDTSTFVVRSRTKFSQVPHWIIRAGKDLSQGARSLYADIMTYADNDKRSAFPGQQVLADDLGVSVRSVRTYMNELEAFGALEVERRRNKRTGNFYANRYVLVFDDPRPHPSEAHCRRPAEPDCRRTTPTNSTITTTPIAATVPETKIPRYRSPSLSERRTDHHLLELVRDIARAETDEDHEAAAALFIEELEISIGEDIGFWDYGWSSKLDSLVKKHGLDYGTAKWLGIFTNSVKAL